MTACTKCGGEVRIISFEHGQKLGAAIAIGWFNSAGVNHHVCTRCGFIESYVRDREALDAIAKKWPPQ